MKIQIIIAIFSKDTDEDQTMHSKSDNTEVMIYDNLDEIIEDFLICFFLDIKLV